MKVGVLALQGDIPEHRAALERVVPPSQIVSVRDARDLESVDALILPGGESTVIAALLEESRLWNPLRDRLSDGLPVLATCAGLILLSRRLDPSPGGRDPPTLPVIDVTVRRNDYGGQRESFEAPVNFDGVDGGEFPGVFIRAPRILNLGRAARAIAQRAGEVVGARSGNVVGLTFHPELSTDPRVHAWFVREVARSR